MNISRLLLIGSLAWLSSLGIMYVIRRFVLTPQQTVQEQVILQKTIDFDRGFVDEKPQLTTIETPRAIWTFSTHGASLEQVTFKRSEIKGSEPLAFLPSLTDHEREKRVFLVALSEKTPYYYHLKGVSESDAIATITYYAQNETAQVEKIYTVHKDSFQVDLDLKIIPNNDKQVSARLFLPAPQLSSLGNDDFAQAIVQLPQGSMQKIQRSSIKTEETWHPAIIGVEDKFFANVLYNDANNFIQHAFYLVTGKRELSAIIQGPTVRVSTQWHLNFYVGPKEEASLAAVDKQLEVLLEYSGILAPLSKILFKILNWLYSYVHNYGWAIIILTLLINIVFLPLNIKSLRSTKKSLEFQKKLDYIKQRYKNDPEILAREQSELIAKHGIPVLGGCLPKLLQLPIFFALSRLLSNSLALYQAPFIGWIHDLSAADPYYLLPLSIVILVVLQSTSTDIKQRFIMIAFALFFGVMAASFSVGICLYIGVGLLLNLIQTFVAQKFKWA